MMQTKCFKDAIRSQFHELSEHRDNKQQIRYRLDQLTVLHQQFGIETKIDVDYRAFL